MDWTTGLRPILSPLLLYRKSTWTFDLSGNLCITIYNTLFHSESDI